MSNQKRGGKGSGNQTKRPKKKSSLPSFGFTDDLLKGKPPKTAAPETAPPETAAPETAPPETAPPETAPPETAAPETAAPETAVPETAAPETAAPERPAAETAARRVSLPAFGFAEDLLRELKTKEAEAVAPRAPAAPEPRAPAAPEPIEVPSPTVAPRSGAATAEDRIFAFADDIEADFEEEKVAPVRLETWVTFGLAGETFALPVNPVYEVVRPSSITRVPHAPYPIRGVTNLRGRVVPVIDLRLRLELPEGEISRSSRVVVVGSRGRRLGLLVDVVHQVVHLDMDRVQPPPDDVMTVQSDYISGVYHMGEELILLLDVDRVLIIKDPITATSPLPSAEAASQGAA